MARPHRADARGDPFAAGKLGLDWLERAALARSPARSRSPAPSRRRTGPISCPRLRIGLGQNVLEGAGAVALGSGAAPPSLGAGRPWRPRPSTRLPSSRMRPGCSAATPQPLALAPFTRGDLDLRLSAAAGADRSRPGSGPRGERPGAGGGAGDRGEPGSGCRTGTVKGRVILASGADPAETDMRLQASLDGIELGTVLGEIGASRWLAGPANGQFTLEASARDSVGLLAHLGGPGGVQYRRRGDHRARSRRCRPPQRRRGARGAGASQRPDGDRARCDRPALRRRDRRDHRGGIARPERRGDRARAGLRPGATAGSPRRPRPPGARPTRPAASCSRSRAPGTPPSPRPPCAARPAIWRPGSERRCRRRATGGPARRVFRSMPALTHPDSPGPAAAPRWRPGQPSPMRGPGTGP